MTLEEQNERIQKAVELLQSVEPIILDAEMIEENKVRIVWNPVFKFYRDFFIELGFMEKLDETVTACVVLENGKKARRNDLSIR